MSLFLYNLPQINLTEIASNKKSNLRVIYGAFFIALLSLYELHIAFLNTMYGEQDVLSKEFFFFFLVIFLSVITNFIELLWRFLNKFSSYVLVLFLIYFFISSVLSPSDIASEYINQLLFYLPVSFLSGFIAFSNFELRKISFLESLAKLKKCVYLLTSINLIVGIYILVGFLNTIDSRFIQIATETNIYYQDFGDAYIKATICILLIQYAYAKSKEDYEKSYSWLIVIVSVQSILAIVNLILIGSNKGTALIFLVAAFILYETKPRNWLFGKGTIRIRFLKLIPILVIILILIGYQLTLIDITKTRLFDYGNAGSIAENSSFTSRFEQFTRGEGESLTENVIFGKLTIIYLHSTVASLQTHLGLVGSILLWTFMLLRSISLYKIKGKGILLKGICLPIMIIGAISSFFTWDLLWFYFGALSTDFRNQTNSL